MQKALENKIKKMQTTRYVRELTLNYYNHKFSSENLNWINLALPINQSIKQTNLSSANNSQANLSNRPRLLDVKSRFTETGF